MSTRLPMMRAPAEIIAPAEVARIEYLGWRDAYLLSNPEVEAVIVPALGRVMQFRFAGTVLGPFWTNPELAGRLSPPDPHRWANFGGDKCWPAPQAHWKRLLGRRWPPPSTFDSAPARVDVGRGEVALVSEVDPRYGIQMVRRIGLDPALPVMTITTEFQKVSGDPVEVAIWVVTQVRHPERIFLVLPDGPRTRPAFEQVRGPPPKGLQMEGRLLSMARDPSRNVKIAAAGDRLLWLGRDTLLRIDARHAAGDGTVPGTVEVYTNKGPLAYVELETVGPPRTLRPGDQMASLNRYVLLRRCGDPVAAQARKALEL